jgi:hypothetical protein
MNIVKTVLAALVLILCAATALGQACETQVIDDAADEPGDRFGDSVAIAMPWMIVGARDDSIPNFEHAGTVFIFKHVNGEWTQVGDHLVQPLGEEFANSRFGHSVAIWQDPGNEDLALAAVGAPKHSGAAGRVFIYRWDGETWGHIETIDDDVLFLDGADGRPHLQGGDELGTGVAITQTTGGRVWIFCGADEDDLTNAEAGEDVGDPDNGMQPNGTQDDRGCVYIFEYDDGSVTLHDFAHATTGYRVREATPQAAARFAWSLAASGDWVVIGAPLRNVVSGTTKPKAGLLTALTWNPEGGPEEDGAWEHHSTLTGTDIVTNRSLGAAVAIAQSVIVAGTRNNRAYLWELVNGTWTQRALVQPTLLDGTTPIGRSGDLFGEWGVAVSKYDDTLYLVAVGAPGDDDHGVNSGSVFTYSYNAQTPATTLIGTLRRPAGVDGNPLSGWGSCDAFGWRVAASGTMVVAGGPQDQNLGGSGSSALGSQGPGIIYLFENVPGDCAASGRGCVSDHAPPAFEGVVVGEVVAERRDGDASVEESLDVGPRFGGVEVESAAGGPVVHASRGADAALVVVDEPVGVHGADAHGGVGDVAEGAADVDRGLALGPGEVVPLGLAVLARSANGLGARDVDAQALVRAGKPARKQPLDRPACAGGGEVEEGRAATQVQAHRDRGDAQERAFEGGGDGPGVDDVDAAVRPGVEPGDEKVGARPLAEALGPDGGEGELDAVGRSAVDRHAAHPLADADGLGHEGLAERHAVARGGLDGERSDDEDFELRAPDGAAQLAPGVEEGVVEGGDARGTEPVIVGQEDAHVSAYAAGRYGVRSRSSPWRKPSSRRCASRAPSARARSAMMAMTSRW